ncbi:ABC transporter substrate-binding protein [Prauserella muralis]|uniref:ABC transporter substrate-binding protein n=1 Tax=Prauserella muralis TaxID=588067 RepID=UPI003CCC71BA
MILEDPINRSRRRLLPLLTALLVVTGCSVFGSDEQPPAPERTTLRVGVGNVIETAPLRMAVAAGEFAAGGLRVELVEQADEDDGLAKLAAGELDVVFGRDAALFTAAATGTALRLQGEAYTAGTDSMALVTVPSSGYEEPSELSAPTIAVDRQDGLGTLTTGSVLRTAGVDPETVTFTERAPQDMAAALAGGEVDAAWMVEPYLTAAQKDLGAIVLADCARGDTQDFPMSAYASSAEFAERNPRTLALFRELLGTAQQRGADESAVRRALPGLADIDPTTASLVSLGTYPTSLNGVRLQRVADLMHGSGLLAERLDVQSLLPKPELS